MFKKLNLTKTQIDLLSFLARNPSTNWYGREISRTSRISVGAVNQTLRDFLRRGFVKREKRGKMYFYSIDLNEPVIKQFKVFLNVSDLDPLTRELRNHTKRIILFGSCAEGKDTEDSDIDLLIVTTEKEKTREIVNEWRNKYTRKLSPIILHSTEFARLPEKDKPFYDRVMRGIELWREEIE
jgi:predicted nucleotidyltransferase/predicted DNA-binding transcriptional regulator